MKRGEVWLVNFDPALPAEADTLRPAVIVSNEGANQAAAKHQRGVVTVVAITSNASRVYPFQVFVPAGTASLTLDSKIQTEQVRSLSVARFGHRLGMLPHALMSEVDSALLLHLAL